MDAPFIIAAFIAGFLMFLAPCTLPLVPAYLGFIGGISSKDFGDPTKIANARKKIFLNAVFFVCGFAVVFIVFGSLAGFVGKTLFQFRSGLTRIGGIFVILFGLFMLKAIDVPFLTVEKKLPYPRLFERGNPVSSLILGASFAFGWTPCIGPVLGSILFLAASASTALQGAFLLSVFSLGLAIPFLFIAGTIASASRYTTRFASYGNALTAVSGIFLIILGFLLFTDTMPLLTSYGFRWLRFINYERILDYL
ncbi:MAG: hypothetical protein A2934_02720 [Candidatus Sungbacteria bacterium RIFCSPLOWO2_01_FULL_47_10]|uniref:Cytochrome C biogenesis protein transmembrane domain-containing protein n=1 Tax=Candidatus Sungbacteria bacterium RIFCSPLOWO2_01_FULL_47_10 TaxID=1802276 RepID=A0A1G2KYW6_9BACT|nr:MAG: hypothetical protein A2934_02720 [Candidatus Sungbacteria bacterium RIFCSPLOWO2_01_FULL_47_10]